MTIFIIRKKPRNMARPVTLNTRGSRFDKELLENEINRVDWNFVRSEGD